MTKMVRDKESIKRKILEFTIQGVEKFLEQNGGLEFYSFAYDCNIEYGEINLCFNTESDFKETLLGYQNGSSAEYYQTEEDIQDLKYNTGDWEYQCFDSLYVYSEKELNEVYNGFSEDADESWNKFLEDLLIVVSESLVEFRKIETYEKIPKTKDFVIYAIDHDEDFVEAKERWNNLTK